MLHPLPCLPDHLLYSIDDLGAITFHALGHGRRPMSLLVLHPYPDGFLLVLHTRPPQFFPLAPAIVSSGVGLLSCCPLLRLLRESCMYTELSSTLHQLPTCLPRGLVALPHPSHFKFVKDGPTPIMYSIHFGAPGGFHSLPLFTFGYSSSSGLVSAHFYNLRSGSSPLSLEYPVEFFHVRVRRLLRELALVTSLVP